MRRNGKKTFLALCAAVALAAALHASPAGAGILDWLFGKGQGQVEQKAETYFVHDEASFKANSRVVHMRPYSDANLEFDITVPNGWTADDVTQNQQSVGIQQSTGQRMIGDLASIRSEMIGIHRVNISVYLQTVKEDISARNWLRVFLSRNGYIAEGDGVQEEGPYRASARYSWVEGMDTLSSYISVQITGNTVILSRADAPLAIKDRLAYAQKAVADSLKLFYPRNAYIEEAKGVGLSDSIKLSYPVSWKPNSPDMRDSSRMAIQLLNRDLEGKIVGFIRVTAVRRGEGRTLAGEIDALKAHLSDFVGLNVRHMETSAKPEKVSPRFAFARTETYSVGYKKPGLSDPFLRLVVLGDKNWYILAYLISPPEKEDLYMWGRNMRAMDIVMETMH
jgi:hypothetical protein